MKKDRDIARDIFIRILCSKRRDESEDTHNNNAVPLSAEDKQHEREIREP
jgi:hypothetical protein